MSISNTAPHEVQVCRIARAEHRRDLQGAELVAFLFIDGGFGSETGIADGVISSGAALLDEGSLEERLRRSRRK